VLEMQKNLKLNNENTKLNQSWMRFADGLADPGTSITELLEKFAAELEQRNKKDKALEIEKEISNRSIQELIHFTPIENLESILRFGFIPRKFLEYPIFDGQINFPDQDRNDGRKDCYCLSISWPNYRMFHKKRLTMPDTIWVVLKLEPTPIINFECFFYNTNAATLAGRKSGDGQLTDMFSNIELRKKLQLEDRFTTDPQAEVLSSSRIPPEFIIEMSIEKNSDEIKYIKRRLYDLGLVKEPNKFKTDDQYFRPREDYEYWRTSC